MDEKQTDDLNQQVKAILKGFGDADPTDKYYSTAANDQQRKQNETDRPRVAVPVNVTRAVPMKVNGHVISDAEKSIVRMQKLREQRELRRQIRDAKTTPARMEKIREQRELRRQNRVQMTPARIQQLREQRESRMAARRIGAIRGGSIVVRPSDEDVSGSWCAPPTRFR